MTKIMQLNILASVSDWFQLVPLQLLSDMIEHTLHSVGGKMCSILIRVIFSLDI